MPDLYRRIEPMRVVHVRHDSEWRPALLIAVRREDERWHAYVYVSLAGGVTQPGWYDETQVRPS